MIMGFTVFACRIRKEKDAPKPALEGLSTRQMMSVSVSSNTPMSGIFSVAARRAKFGTSKFTKSSRIGIRALAYPQWVQGIRIRDIADMDIMKDV